MKVKKTIVILLCVLMLSSTAFVYAAAGDDISLKSDNYHYASAELSISSGTATVKGSIKGIIGTTTKTTVHLYLQQYKNGEWINYEDWLESKNGANCTVTKMVSVSRGYRYRTKASCYAYVGSKSEHVTKYSGEVQY